MYVAETTFDRLYKPFKVPTARDILDFSHLTRRRRGSPLPIFNLITPSPPDNPQSHPQAESLTPTDLLLAQVHDRLTELYLLRSTKARYIAQVRFSSAQVSCNETFGAGRIVPRYSFKKYQTRSR